MDRRSLPDQAASLADVSQDVLLLVGEACSDPLAPMALAHLAATSSQILTVLRPKLNELRDFRAELRALCSKAGTHVSSLAEVEELVWVECSLALAEITVLGRLLRSVALPRLGSLGLKEGGTRNFSERDGRNCRHSVLWTGATAPVHPTFATHRRPLCASKDMCLQPSLDGRGRATCDNRVIFSAASCLAVSRAGGRRLKCDR